MLDRWLNGQGSPAGLHESLRDSVRRVQNTEQTILPGHFSRGMHELVRTRLLFAHVNPGAYATEDEITKLRPCIDTENRIAATRLLPTQGLEIEAPYSGQHEPLQEKRIGTLNQLGYQSDSYYSDSYTEVRSGWSYSSKVQKATIDSLYQLGVIPHIPYRTVSGMPTRISLHINFGIPEDVQEFITFRNYRRPINALNDILTLAYTSFDRLGQRKEAPGYSISARNVDHTPFNSSPGRMRLELRSYEVTTDMIDALLDNSQVLSAGLFAYVAREFGRNLSETSTMLAIQFEEFLREVYKRRNDFLIMDNFMDEGSRPRKKFDFIKPEEIVLSCRQLVEKTAQNMKKLINADFPGTFPN